MTLDGDEYGDREKLDSDEEEVKQFQDLVIKFSNLSTLLQPGAGRFGNANDHDIRHKIDKTDYAVIIGVSTQDNLPHSSVGKSPENDARVMSDICRIHFGMKPSRVKLLTSHTKQPTRDHIRKALKEGFKTAGSDDLILIYFSGHGYCRKEEHYLIPQDFRTDDVKGTCISSKNMYKWLSSSKCQRIVVVLDCCYAEQFTEALYRAKGGEELNKHLYLLASSELAEPSVSDESWLEHGYMTFLIKHYLNFVCAHEHQLSLRRMTQFIKKYSEPLSRFTYTVYDGQVTQRPVLAHIGPGDQVEVDAAYDYVDPTLVEYWSGRIRKSSAYQSWWKSRLGDAKVLLSDVTFSYSRLYYLIYLNSLHSLCILLCERDSFHNELRTHEPFNAFSAALEEVLTRDLETLTNPEFEKYDRRHGVADPRGVIRGGISEGIRSVSEPSAPPPAYGSVE